MVVDVAQRFTHQGTDFIVTTVEVKGGRITLYGLSVAEATRRRDDLTKLLEGTSTKPLVKDSAT